MRNRFDSDNLWRIRLFHGDFWNHERKTKALIWLAWTLGLRLRRRRPPSRQRRNEFWWREKRDLGFVWNKSKHVINMFFTFGTWIMFDDSLPYSTFPLHWAFGPKMYYSHCPCTYTPCSLLKLILDLCLGLHSLPADCTSKLINIPPLGLLFFHFILIFVCFYFVTFCMIMDHDNASC